MSWAQFLEVAGLLNFEAWRRLLGHGQTSVAYWEAAGSCLGTTVGSLVHLYG